MPRYSPDEIADAARLVYPAGDLDRDIFGQPEPRQRQVLSYLAQLLLDNPDFYPRLVWYWAQGLGDRLRPWREMLLQAIEIMSEGVGTDPDFPRMESYTRPDLRRMARQLQSSLGSVVGGLRASRKEACQLLSSILEWDPLVEFPTFQVVNREVLVQAAMVDRRLDDSELAELVNSHLDKPRKLWLLLMAIGGNLADGNTRPWADNPRDVITGSIIPEQPAMIGLDKLLPRDDATGSFDYEVDGTGGTVTISGGRPAVLSAVKEPYEFHDNHRAAVWSGPNGGSGFLSSSAWWEVYVDGTVYRIQFPPGSYTTASSIGMMSGASSPAGDPITAVCNIYQTPGNVIRIEHINPGGRIIVGDGYSGTNVNSFLKFDDWQDSDSHPRGVQGWEANNRLRLMVDCQPSSYYIVIPEGTYTASSLVTTIQPLLPPQLTASDDNGHLVLETVSHQSRSRIRVVDTQDVLGWTAGLEVRGSGYLLQDFIRDIDGTGLQLQQDVLVVYQGSVTVSGPTSISIPSGSFEIGDVVVFTAGPLVGQVAEVTAAAGSSATIDPPVCGGFGTTNGCRVLRGEMHLVSADGCHLAITSSTTDVISPGDCYRQGTRLAVSSSRHGLQYVRPGDLLVTPSGPEMVVSVNSSDSTLILANPQRCSDYVDVIIESSDWESLRNFRFEDQPEFRTKLTSLLGAFSSRPSAAVAAEIKKLLQQQLDWCDSALQAIDNLEVRSLKPVDSFLSKCRQSKYDLLYDKLVSATDLEEIFNADFKLSTAETISELMQQAIRPGDELQQEQVAELSQDEVSGDDDIDIPDEVIVDPWQLDEPLEEED